MVQIENVATLRHSNQQDYFSQHNTALHLNTAVRSHSCWVDVTLMSIKYNIHYQSSDFILFKRSNITNFSANDICFKIKVTWIVLSRKHLPNCQ